MKLTQANFCKKHGISEDQFFGAEAIEGSLHLRGLTSIPEGFNPAVKGSLHLIKPIKG